MTIEPPAHRETYPAVAFICRHGTRLALVAGLLPPCLGLVAAAVGHGWWWIVAGVLAGAIGFLLMKSYSELVRIIAATLLPD